HPAGMLFFPLPYLLHGKLHQTLCVLPGDEHPFIYIKRIAHEFTASHEVLERNALFSLSENRVQIFPRFVGNHPVQTDKILPPADAKLPFQQRPGFIFKIFYFRLFQPFLYFFPDFLSCHAAQSCSSPFRMAFTYSLQSKTPSTDAMATSSMESSGSFVVKYCRDIPGLLKIFMILESLLPARRMNS